MAEITQFTVQTKKAQLLVTLSNNTSCDFTFEYLRVFSPAEENSKGNNLVTHKKLVKLEKIESVGKHGYRLVFDDGHHAIYSTDYLLMLDREHQQRWQHYLNEVKNSPHNREASIDITEL